MSQSDSSPRFGATSEAALRVALEDWRATVGDYRAGLLNDDELRDRLGSANGSEITEARLRRTRAAVETLLDAIDPAGDQ